MDEHAVQNPHTPALDDPPVFTIGGVDVVGFDAVVTRLCRAYPDVSAARIEKILVREWEAFTAGRPLVVPVGVEACVREMLDAR